MIYFFILFNLVVDMCVIIAILILIKQPMERKMIKDQTQAEALMSLQHIKYHSTIYSIIKHVSKSGMTRHISFFYIEDNEPHYITNKISDLLGYRMNKHHDALVVGGCGMDMAFSVVNNLEDQLNSCLRTPKHKLKSRIM